MDTPQDITWHYWLDIHDSGNVWYTVVLEMLP